jgi:hypothetical protein
MGRADGTVAAEGTVGISPEDFKNKEVQICV